jgi:hypothetical protein
MTAFDSLLDRLTDEVLLNHTGIDNVENGPQ